MGFFSLKATCGVCGQQVGLNRYKVALDNAWCCPKCYKLANKRGNCVINFSTITIDQIKKLIEGGMDALKENKEYRKKCNVCGHIFCYSDEDLYRNKKLMREAKSQGNMAVLEALGGTRIASNQRSDAMDRTLDKIVDYDKCPQCHSSNLSDATEEDLRKSAGDDHHNHVSSADELKKYKDLLDSGILTQEEFDAKKKQLLGL